MKLAIPRIHMVVGGITMLLIVLQFFLAGVGVFGASDYDMHRSVGYLIAVLAALLFVLTLVGSLDRRRVLFSGLLLLLMIVQIALIESDEPWVMAFHPLNGLLILGAGSEMMRDGRKAMREARVGAPAGMRAAEGD